MQLVNFGSSIPVAPVLPVDPVDPVDQVDPVDPVDPVDAPVADAHAQFIGIGQPLQTQLGAETQRQYSE